MESYLKFFLRGHSMDVYKFITWADTHWDKLGAKCVTLDDTDRV